MEGIIALIFKNSNYSEKPSTNFQKYVMDSNKLFNHEATLHKQFVKDTNIDLVKEFEQTKLNNPVTDIVDSYYIAKYGYES